MQPSVLPQQPARDPCFRTNCEVKFKNMAPGLLCERSRITALRTNEDILEEFSARWVTGFPQSGKALTTGSALRFAEAA